MTYTLGDREKAFSILRETKKEFAARHWFPATSGNLSVRLKASQAEEGADQAGESSSSPLVFAITSSGKDKSKETPEDFLLVNEYAKPVEKTNLRPSAETLIHSEIYRHTDAGAIFHVHTVFNNLASELFAEQTCVPVKDVELIKAFNIWEEDARIEIPILPNYADIPRIAELIEESIVPKIPGILLRKHGIYAWGKNEFEAKRHLEAFEFLFEYVVRWKSLGQ
jgi:methylthioribulose-1-phosphate dehydratase